MPSTSDSKPTGQHKKVRRARKSRLGRDIWFRLRTFVICHPAIYFAYYRLLNKNAEIAVSEATEIVVEGFCGSGNTFSVRALRANYSDSFRIAHHMHAPAQIIRGLELGKPVVVLIRDPADASASEVSRHTVVYDDASLEHILINLLKTYCVFYKAVLPYKDDVVIAPFEEVVKDLGAIIERTNEKFGTDFPPLQQTDKNVGRDMSTYKPVKRVADKDEIKALICSPRFEKYLSEARQLREQMLA